MSDIEKVRMYLNGIIRDNGERDKVYIQATCVLGELDRFELKRRAGKQIFYNNSPLSSKPVTKRV